MQIIAETHSHTVACDHAFSTLYENVRYAARSGIRFLCVTEHCPAMEGAPGGMFFSNLPNVIPDLMEGVVVLKGAEHGHIGLSLIHITEPTRHEPIEYGEDY